MLRCTLVPTRFSATSCCLLYDFICTLLMFKSSKKPVSVNSDLAQEYNTALDDLTLNSKPIINNLTVIADENKESAADIVSIIENRITNNQVAHKLPVLYLVDSILKNIGGIYLKLFSQNIIRTFCDTYLAVPPPVRKQMSVLFETWITTRLFPDELLQELHTKVKGIEAAQVHVNPAFVQTQAGRSQAQSIPKAAAPTKGSFSAKAPTKTATRSGPTRPHTQILTNPPPLRSRKSPQPTSNRGGPFPQAAGGFGGGFPQHPRMSPTAQNPGILPNQNPMLNPMLANINPMLNNNPNLLLNQNPMLAAANPMFNNPNPMLANPLLANPLLHATNPMLATNPMFGNAAIHPNMIMTQNVPSLIPASNPMMGGSSIMGLSPPPVVPVTPNPNESLTKESIEELVAILIKSLFIQAFPELANSCPSTKQQLFDSRVTVIKQLETKGLLRTNPQIALWVSQLNDLVTILQAVSGQPKPVPGNMMPLSDFRAAGTQGARGPPDGIDSVLSHLLDPSLANALEDINQTEDDSIATEWKKVGTINQPLLTELIRELYKSVDQCTQCGLRISDGKKMSLHYDWHFRRNKQEREKMKNAISRMWFVSKEFWVSPNDQQAEQPMASFGEDPEAPPEEPQIEQTTEAREDQMECPSCGEPFGDYYDQERDQWINPNSVIGPDDKIYHTKCLNAQTLAAINKTLEAAKAEIAGHDEPEGVEEDKKQEIKTEEPPEPHTPEEIEAGPEVRTPEDIDAEEEGDSLKRKHEGEEWAESAEKKAKR